MSRAAQIGRWVLIAGVLPPATAALMLVAPSTGGLEPFRSFADYVAAVAYMGLSFGIIPVVVMGCVAWRFRRGTPAKYALPFLLFACGVGLMWSVAALIAASSPVNVSFVVHPKPAWVGAPIFRWTGESKLAGPIVLLIASAWVTAWVTRRRPPLANECSACRYDVSSSTTGRCPECGTTLQRRE
jgi:hypothetical protein